VLQALQKSPGLELWEEYSQHSLYQYVLGKPPIYTENGKTMANPAIGFSHRLLTSSCTIDKESPAACVWSNGKLSIHVELFSIAIGVDKIPDFVKVVKEIIRVYPAPFPLISIFIRFAKATDSYMAVENSRDTAHVELTLPARVDQYNTPKMGLAACQAIIQASVKLFLYLTCVL